MGLAACRTMIAALALAAMLHIVPAAGQKTNAHAESMRELGAAGLSGEKLKEAIEKAEQDHLLGSLANPVRADGPAGERAYLATLRCDDGAAPTFERRGSIGAGIYGYIIDLYQVTCTSGPAVEVHMDMYHDHHERTPLPGFSIMLPPDAT